MVKKVVLAYSGGLDTSIILHWLRDTYDCEVVTFTANLGQDDDYDLVREKAKAAGVTEIFIDDLREEFIRDYVFPMFRANTVYEGEYLLGTSIARPLIAKRQIEIANETVADAVSHGATGKGNDQIRFELGYYGLRPDITVIAPWREWDLNSRTKLLAYASEKGIPIPKGKENEPPYSMDANMMHISFEGNALEDPWEAFDYKPLEMSCHPKDAPDEVEELTLTFKKGDPVALNGKTMKPHELFAELNKIGGKHGIGVIDIVENRFVGMKSRGAYETPGGTILLKAHRAIESLCLDKGAMHLKDELMPKYAEIIYNGFWWSPERDMLQAAIDTSQERVEGDVRLNLYKGNVMVAGRRSPNSLYSEDLATFEEDEVYNQRDAEGFIKLQSLRLRMAG